MEHMSKASVFLAVFKRIFIQLLKIEKLGEGHVKGEGNPVEGFHSRVFGQPSHDVVEGRLLYGIVSSYCVEYLQF